MNVQSTTQAIGALLPRKKLAQDLGICVRTLMERGASDPNFPRAIIINSRRFYAQCDIERYKRNLLARAMPGARAKVSSEEEATQPLA